MRWDLLMSGLLALLVLTSCATVSELDFKALGDKKFSVTELTFLVSDTVDTTHSAKTYLTDQFPKVIPAIVKAVSDSTGAVVDVEELTAALRDPAKIKELDPFGSGKVKINIYSWQATAKYAQEAFVSFPFVIYEDGTVKINVTLRRTDPKTGAKQEKVVDVLLKATPIGQ